MDPRDIEYFSVIAEHGHLGRAAEALGLGQPALSMSLRRLEKSAQAKLVRRTPKGVELTAVGAALLPHVHRLRLAREDLAHEVADLAQGRKGHLRVGVSPMTSEYLVAAYTALMKSAPKLTLQITDSDNDVMVPALRSGELDLVFNYTYQNPPEGTAQEHIYDEDWVVCASANHRLSEHKRVSLKDLVDEQWALSRVNTLAENLLTRTFLDRALAKPLVAFEARSTQIRLQIVAKSNLLAYTPKRIVNQMAQRLRLRALPVKELMLRRHVGVIYRKDGYLPPVAHRFIEILKTTTSEGLGGAV